MNSLLGHVAALAGLLCSLVGAAVAFFAGRRGTEGPRRLALDLCVGVFAAALLAFVVMEVALVTHDFSVGFVAQVGRRDVPLLFTIASGWSALEGSILLWVLILAGYTLALALWMRRRDADDALGPYALGTTLLVNAFFFLLLVGPADPFEAVYPVPADGPGPNPLLLNNAFMAVHPPLLYAGYVGLTVPFGLAVAGLLRGRLGADWCRSIRRWTLLPWSLLTLGILAGAWWSYEVLGWGGYWAWDPVENASFMPWLVATAFIHSLIVQDQRRMLKAWTVSLAIAAFLLTLLGTFLTRSGILASVHAFTESGIGAYFLAFMALVALVSLALVAWRMPALRAPGSIDAVASRETAFLVNNLLFTAFTLVIILGTLFPLVVEALQGDRITVGAPYFNATTAPIALTLVFLAGVGPALPWGQGPEALLRRKFALPAVAGAVVAAALFAAGMRDPMALLTFGLTAFSAGLVVGEFARPAAARRRAHGESWPRALGRIVMKNRRRYGGYFAHIGILIAAVGIAASSAFRDVRERTLRVGGESTLGDYSVRLDSVWAAEDPHRERVVAGVHLAAADRSLGAFYPSLNYYPNSPQPIGTPAIDEGPARDLYLVLAHFEPDHSGATVQLIVNPGILWIWVGGILTGLSGLFAFWPARRGEAGPGPADR